MNYHLAQINIADSGGDRESESVFTFAKPFDPPPIATRRLAHLQILN